MVGKFDNRSEPMSGRMISCMPIVPLCIGTSEMAEEGEFSEAVRSTRNIKLLVIVACFVLVP